MICELRKLNALEYSVTLFTRLGVKGGSPNGFPCALRQWSHALFNMKLLEDLEISGLESKSTIQIIRWRLR
jgi:hypothetical protein